jgi:hypothetical protein
MKKINKLFIITSFCAHLILLLIMFLANPRKNIINEHFLILGAHSQIPTQAFFRPTRNIKQTNWLKKRMVQEKTAHEKRMALKKQAQAKINKPKPQIKKAPPKQTTISKGIKTEPARKIANNMKNTESKKERKKAIQTTENNIEEININLRGQKNPQFIAFEKEMQNKISKYWKPPIGVPKATIATIEFLIDKKGLIENFKITEKSNVLIYDLSILKALSMLKNKKEKLSYLVQGKKISMDFMQ